MRASAGVHLSSQHKHSSYKAPRGVEKQHCGRRGLFYFSLAKHWRGKLVSLALPAPLVQLPAAHSGAGAVCRHQLCCVRTRQRQAPRKTTKQSKLNVVSAALGSSFTGPVQPRTATSAEFELQPNPEAAAASLKALLKYLLLRQIFNCILSKSLLPRGWEFC